MFGVQKFIHRHYFMSEMLENLTKIISTVAIKTIYNRRAQVYKSIATGLADVYGAETSSNMNI